MKSCAARSRRRRRPGPGPPSLPNGRRDRRPFPADAGGRLGLDPQRRDRASRAQRDRRRTDFAAEADRPRSRQSLGQGRGEPVRHRQQRDRAPDRFRGFRRPDRQDRSRDSPGRSARKYLADERRIVETGHPLIDIEEYRHRRRTAERSGSPRPRCRCATTAARSSDWSGSRATSRRASGRRRCATVRRRFSK